MESFYTKNQKYDEEDRWIDKERWLTIQARMREISKMYPDVSHDEFWDIYRKTYGDDI